MRWKNIHPDVKELYLAIYNEQAMNGGVQQEIANDKVIELMKKLTEKLEEE